MTKNLYLYSIIALNSLLFQAISVAEPWSERVYINGFYTIDLTYTDEDIGLVSNSHRPRSYDNESAGLENSVFGGQVELEINENISAFMQGKLFYGSHDNASSKVDWAYLSYDFGEDTRVRGGLFQIPFLQGTELRNIGFSRIWARPLIPEDGASGFNEYLGLEYLKSVYTGNSHWDFQAAAGVVEHENDSVESRNIELMTARYQYKGFWIRSAFIHGEYAVNDSDGDRLSFSGNAFLTSIEAELAYAGMIINGGYGISRTDITPDTSIYYVSVAFPLGHVIPYLYTSKRNLNIEQVEAPPPTPGIPPDGNPPPDAVPLPPPEDGLPKVGDYDVYSLAIGARWHVTERFGFKFQWENIEQNNPANYQGNAPTNNGNTVSILFEGVF